MSDSIITLGAFLAILLLAFAFVVGFDRGEASVRKAAIKAGAARRVVDQETGIVSFEFITRRTMEEVKP